MEGEKGKREGRREGKKQSEDERKQEKKEGRGEGRRTDGRMEGRKERKENGKEEGRTVLLPLLRKPKLPGVRKGDRLRQKVSILIGEHGAHDAVGGHHRFLVVVQRKVGVHGLRGGA
jgi:hypothetical protein